MEFGQAALEGLDVSETPMRILINGNMGYIGPIVVAHLRRVFPDAWLAGNDSGWFAHCLTTPAPLPELALDEQRFVDVRALTARDLDGFDAVVQLAAVSNDPMSHRFETVTDDINHLGAVHVAKIAAAAGVRSFVFASSCSIYGFAADGRPRTETDPVNPLTAYARSKIATEGALEALAFPAMTVTALRFSTACGMSPRLRLDLVMNDFVAGALTSGQISVLSDGTPWRPMIEVRDMARAIEWGICRQAAPLGRFLKINVGVDRWNCQVKDIAEAVARAIPGTTVTVNPDAPLDKRSYRVDFGLYAQHAPDHQPLQTLDSAIAGLRDGLKAIAFADPDYRGSQLIRLKVLERHLDSGALDARLRWTRRGTA